MLPPLDHIELKDLKHIKGKRHQLCRYRRLRLGELIIYAPKQNTFENEKGCYSEQTLEKHVHSMPILGKSRIMGTLYKEEFICVQNGEQSQ